VLDFCWATAGGPVWTRHTGEAAVFFVARADMERVHRTLAAQISWRWRELTLQTYTAEPVNGLYFSSMRAARRAEHLLLEQNIRCWEADIRPHERFLMERFISAAAQLEIPANRARQPWVNPALTPCTEQPALRWVSLDIETSMDAQQLYSIAVLSDSKRQVFMVGEGEPVESAELCLHYCADTRACLQAFLHWIAAEDPDVLLGWNLVQFDLWVLESLCRREMLAFTLGRGARTAHWREEQTDGGRRFISIPGRVALDGIELLKAANYSFESFSLETVARQLLSEGKLLSGAHRGEDISRLFHEDKSALAAYNLHDCELVWDIFTRQKLVDFAVARSQLTGHLLDRIGGSVAAFEYAYLPRLHRRGYVAPNLGEQQSEVVSPGGYVMDSRPGLYDNVLVLDFKSLYPSIIRTFLIDPCGFWQAEHQDLNEAEAVEGFNGARFAREGHILPDIVTELSAARDRAKHEANEPLSHAIKIIMNSFYGVLGSSGCRFFDPRVSSSITLRGHEIIQRSREWIEQQGYAVIYGDTDSLFIWLENHTAQRRLKTPKACQKIGQRLTQELNQWWQTHLWQKWQLHSALEIQVDTHYQRFLMPTLRGSDLGTKKRYAGLVDKGGELQLVFKGLENVRTDWTRLARQFQEELYKRIFFGEPYREFVRETVRALLAAERDNELVYRKRLRRSLGDYQKNIPPHVQAARKQAARIKTPVRRGDWIDYVITTQGAEPAAARLQPFDYQHYLEKQLAPVADAILYFIDDSFAAITDRQLMLF